MLLDKAIALAYTPAGCDEAEGYRAALGAMTDYAAKMLEDRIGNLEWSVKKIAFTDHREKEEIRTTISGLKREHAEFFKGEQGKGWSR